MLPVPALAEARFRPSREGALLREQRCGRCTRRGRRRVLSLGDDLARGRAGACVRGGLAGCVRRRGTWLQLDIARRVVIRGVAGRQKAMIAMLAKTVVHRDMGSLLWLGTIASISDIGSQTGNQRS
jgi:hypothetical protein